MNLDFDHSSPTTSGHIGSYNTSQIFTFQFHQNSAPESSLPTSLLRCPLPSVKFVGRRDELEKLKQFFASNDSDRKVFALIGMSGCGKSQIGFEFTHNHVLLDDRYNQAMVFFIDASTLTTLEESYALIAKSKGIGSSAEDALLWLSNTRDLSFVLIDNADDSKIDLNDYIPRSMNVHVLITTRLHHAGRQYAGSPRAYIDVEALNVEDAEKLLVSTAQLGLDEREGVRTLVQELYCHALAVAQAGAGIAVLQLTVLEYTEHYRRLCTRLMNGTTDGVGRIALGGYPKHVSSTWYINYDELPPSSKALFGVFAHFHHTGITEQVFCKAHARLRSYEPTIPLSPAEDKALASVKQLIGEFDSESDQSFDSLAFHRCMQNILALSLMRYHRNMGTYSIHPLIHDGLRCIVDNHLPTSFLLASAIHADEHDEVFIYRLGAHVDRVLERGSEGSAESAVLHPDIALSFANVLCRTGQWARAETMERSAAEKRCLILGGDDEYTLKATTALAGTLEELGRANEAEVMEQDVLGRWRRKEGEDHPRTIEALGNLASTLQTLGRFANAEQIRVDLLEKQRRTLGENHQDTLVAMGNLASTWHSLGRADDAEEMESKLLEKRRLISGEDHPATLSAMSNLASTWKSLGRYDEAEKMNVELLERRSRILGEDHPDTLISMGNLVSSLHSLGRLEEAEMMATELLRRQKLILGEAHPNTLIFMSNLAAILSSLGRFDESLAMERELLEKQQRNLGEDHKTTLVSMGNLSVSLYSNGQVDEAVKLGRELLEKRRRILGEDHTNTLTALSNLVAMLSSLKQLDEAEAMGLELLEKLRHILGDDHPDTLISMGNLAATFHSLGRNEESIAMLGVVVEKSSEILGDDHPRTVAARARLERISRSLSSGQIGEASDSVLSLHSEGQPASLQEELMTGAPNSADTGPTPSISPEEERRKKGFRSFMKGILCSM